MAKVEPISEITSSYASQGKLNENFQTLSDSFTNTLSRDGSGPNNMLADLDMDGNNVLNAGIINAIDYRIDGQPFGFAEALTEATEQALDAQVYSALALTYAERAEAAENSLLKWRGPWVTATMYRLGEIVQVNGSSYIAVQNHVSGVFNTDLSNDRWQLFVQRGANGSGSGDMLGSNNLNELTNPVSARTNLGLGTIATTDVSTYQSNQTEWNTGTSSTQKLISPAQLQTKLNASIPTNAADYTSPQIAVTSGGAYTASHNFGAHASRLQLWLVCVIAQNGYSVGDRVPVSAELNAYEVNRGIAVASRTNSIYIKFGSEGNVFEILNLNTGTRGFANNGNWRLLITAWK